MSFKEAAGSGPSTKGSSTNANIEADRPVTKMKHYGQPPATVEYGTKHQTGLPKPKGMHHKTYTKAAIMKAMGGGGGTYADNHTKGQVGSVK